MRPATQAPARSPASCPDWITCPTDHLPAGSHGVLPGLAQVVCDDLSVTTTAAPPRPQGEVDSRAPEAAGRHTSGRTLVLFGTLLAVALMLALPIRTWLAQRAELDTMQADIVAAQQRVAELQKEQSQWQDPAFIEAQARLRLNMVMPGESGLIALDRAELAAEEAPDPPAVTWYDKVWRSTEAAAGRRPAPAAESSTDGG